jgi:hypothetical protein
VVGVVENDGVGGETGFFEFLEAFSSRSVSQRDLIIILRPILADFRRVGMIRGHTHFCGVMNRDMRAFAELALVAAGFVEDREEGLAVLAVLPIRIADDSSHTPSGFARL